MEERHRRALATCADEIAGETGLELTEDFISALNLCGLFPRTWISQFMIPNLSTSHQVYKMMELLPKRGPSAFYKFLEVLNYDYPWLSKKLAIESGDQDALKYDSLNTESITTSNSETQDEFLSLVALVDSLQRVQETLQNTLNDLEHENKSIKLKNEELETCLRNKESGGSRETILENKIQLLQDELHRVRFENESLKKQLTQTREIRQAENREEKRWNRLRDRMRSMRKSVG